MTGLKYQFIESGANLSSSIKAAHIKKQYHEERKLDYHQAIFPGGRIIWGIFLNKYYDEELEGVRNGDEKHTEHYKHEFSIPKYKIYKNGVKIGFAFPRHAHKHDESPYLYVPETLRFNKRKYNKTGISRDFYIFDVNKQHTINDKAVLLRFLS